LRGGLPGRYLERLIGLIGHCRSSLCAECLTSRATSPSLDASWNGERTVLLSIRCGTCGLRA